MEPVTEYDQQYSYPQLEQLQDGMTQFGNMIGSPYGRVMMYNGTNPAQTLPLMRNGYHQESPGTTNKKSKRPISAVNGKTFETQTDYLQQMFQPYMPHLTKKFNLSSNDFVNSTYRKKLIPSSMMYKKEDLYDQNIFLKLQINDYREDNMKLRTKIAQLMTQLKGRDKLFDDLYKSAFITTTGTLAKNNINKDVLLIVNLKKQVQDLKDSLYNKDAEIFDLKKDIKSTKIKELETELKTYMHECLRLRQVTNQAVKMSGEIDLKRLQQANFEQTQQFQMQQEQFQLQISESNAKLQKMQNYQQQSRLDIQSLNQKIEFYEQKVEQLKERLKNTEDDRDSQIDQKINEIQKLNNKVNKLKEQIEQLKNQQNNQDYKIKQLNSEISEKSDKIEQLCEELIQKDTTIAQHSMLNKNIQKTLDQEKYEHQQTRSQIDVLNNQLQEESQEKKKLMNKMDDLTGEVAKLQSQMKRENDDNQQEIQNLQAKSKKVQEDIILKIQEISKLKQQIENLQNSEQNLQQEITKKNEQVDLKDAEIVQLIKVIDEMRNNQVNMKKVSSKSLVPENEDIKNEESEDDIDPDENKTILSQSLLEKEEQNSSRNHKEFEIIVEQTELILKDIGQQLVSQAQNFREFIGESNIYTINVAHDDQEAQELEVIPFKQFISKMDKLSSIKLQQSEKDFLQKIFSLKNNRNLMNLNQLTKIFKNLGVKDDQPRSKKHLNYEQLNLQSKRILNRLISYMEDNELTDQDVFGDIIIESTVKTKTKSEKVEIIKAQEFFDKLFQLEIIIQNSVKVNLAKFLCIDEAYLNSLMYKKLKRAISDFRSSETLKSIGVCKRKIPENILNQSKDSVKLKSLDKGIISQSKLNAPQSNKESQQSSQKSLPSVIQSNTLIKASDYIKQETQDKLKDEIADKSQQPVPLIKQMSKQSSIKSNKPPKRQVSNYNENTLLSNQIYNGDQTQTLVGFELINTQALNGMTGVDPNKKASLLKPMQSGSDDDFNQRATDSIQDPSATLQLPNQEQYNEDEERKSEYTYKTEEVSEYYSESQDPDSQRQSKNSLPGKRQSTKKSQDKKKSTLKPQNKQSKSGQPAVLEKPQRVETDEILKLEQQFNLQHAAPNRDSFDPFNPFPAKPQDEEEEEETYGNQQPHKEEESYYDDEEEGDEPDFERDSNQRDYI